MISSQVNIDFKFITLAFQKFIREKAKQTGGTIVYKYGNQLIEENPTTFTKKVLKEYSHSK